MLPCPCVTASFFGRTCCIRQATGPFPVLVYRTPYGKDSAEKEYTTFQHAVERGYAVVVQDVRGRYESDGNFVAYQQEGHDGYDTIEWAAAQPWSNGSVGTFGLSYPGAVQWLAAVENPPHLKAMVPAMTFSTPQNFFFAWGTWDMSWIDWIWNTQGPNARVKKTLPGPRTDEEATNSWKTVGPAAYRKLPLSDLKELKDIAPYYYEWLRHPMDDAWWDWAELRNKYQNVNAAVLNLSAWYDDNYGPEGATTNFAGLLKTRVGNDPRTHLLLGPWVHGVDSTAKAKSGEREFAANARIDYDETILRWFDHYLRGIDNGIDKEKPVRYFVMGDDQWRESDTWPPSAKQTSFYLIPTADHTKPGPGILSSSPGRARGNTSFRSDPAEPVTNPYASSGAHDYRIFADRQDVLTFDSAPLEQSTEVTGPITAQVFVSCDCRDLDLWVHLLDVAPEGAAFNLMSPGLNVLRASYRDAKRRQLLTPGKIYRLDLDHLITSNVFRKGHRIRVQISGSFFPNFSRNLQTGELETSSAKMQAATIRIHHDDDHQSRIILPVVER
jgi:putative CocE/NonD family hydrolase